MFCNICFHVAINPGEPYHGQESCGSACSNKEVCHKAEYYGVAHNEGKIRELYICECHKEWLDGLEKGKYVVPQPSRPDVVIILDDWWIDSRPLQEILDERKYIEHIAALQDNLDSLHREKIARLKEAFDVRG
jgi:hypothetical protein